MIMMKMMKMMKNKQQMLWLLIFILLLPSFAMAQPPLPCSITGVVTIDGIPTGGITVQIENINTGEVRTTTTSPGNPPYEKWMGYYTEVISGQNDHTVKITVSYGGYIYCNTTKIDLTRVTQWLNLSIVPGEMPPDPPPGGNGETPEEPEGPSEDPEEPEEPNGNETEEPEQNETENGNETTYHLTVKVVDNATGDPISSASVTIYCNTSKIAKSYTNDTGTVSFVLEEGDYTVEVMKEGYSGKSGSFTLLCSVEQPFSLDKKGDDNPNPQPTEDQGVPLYVYGIICAIVVIIILGVIIYWRYH